MALLYEDIMKVPGLSGSWQDRLNNFGQRFFGGGYSGSYDQNMNLYGRIQRGDYGTTPAATMAPTAVGTRPGTSGVPTPTARTPFSQVLPFEKLFNRNLVTGLAESQINPEVERERYKQLQSLNSSLAESGMFRTGRGVQATQNLNDALERQRKEQIQAFSGNIQNSLTDYYNRLYDQYNRNPSAFVMPQVQTADDYLRLNPSLAAAYGAATNVPTTYSNPLLY